jgi:hypothetical protein
MLRGLDHVPLCSRFLMTGSYELISAYTKTELPRNRHRARKSSKDLYFEAVLDAHGKYEVVKLAQRNVFWGEFLKKFIAADFE